MPGLAPKVLGVILLSAVGVLLSYVILDLYTEAFPEYAYKLFPSKQLKPGAASTLGTEILPTGPVAPVPLVEVPPATRADPTAPSIPAPLSVRESTMAMDLLASTLEAPRSAVGPPSTQTAPPRHVRQGLGSAVPLTAPPNRPAWRVQAGAFKQREYADILTRQLRANGYSVTLVEEPLLRVWVGPALSRTAAERLASNLRSIGFEAFLSPIR